MSRFVSYLIVILGFVLISGVAPVQGTSEDWKKDFETFIDVLTPMFKRNPLHSELREKFEGQQVTWTGEFKQITSNGKSKVVWLKMPPKAVTLSNGKEAKVYTLLLVPEENNLKKWEDTKAGETVRFKTTLKGDSDIPAVYVGQYQDGVNAGKYHILIQTNDAELVHVFPSRAGTYKYRIKAEIAELVTDEKGDLSPEYPAIKKKLERLIENASRFDLTKDREIGEYAKYVGNELSLPKGKEAGFEIKTDSGKKLFVGKLRLGKSGEYELVPSNKGK